MLIPDEGTAQVAAALVALLLSEKKPTSPVAAGETAGAPASAWRRNRLGVGQFTYLRKFLKIMPNKINESKTFHAVFDANTVKEFDSYENALNQSPSYIVTSYNVKGFSSWAGQNWSRKWEIDNLMRPGFGFAKGLWKSSKEFETDSAFSPGTPYYEIIDPKGIKRRFRTESINKGIDYIQQIIAKVYNLYNYDSWKQLDLEVENSNLKKRILELEAEVLSLKE